MALNEELINQKIDELLGAVEEKLLKKSVVQEDEDEEANGGKNEEINSGVKKAVKDNEDDEDDEDEDDEDEDDEDMEKSLALALEGFQSLIKSFNDKKKKKKKKEKEDDKEDHKDVAIDHVCDNKDKDVHKEMALEHFKKAYAEDINLLKAEIERLKATPIPPKGVPAGVVPLKKSEEGTVLQKSEVLSTLLELKKANPDSVDSRDIMAVELGKEDPAKILQKYRKG